MTDGGGSRIIDSDLMLLPVDVRRSSVRGKGRERASHDQQSNNRHGEGECTGSDQYILCQLGRRVRGDHPGLRCVPLLPRKHKVKVCGGGAHVCATIPTRLRNHLSALRAASFSLLGRRSARDTGPQRLCCSLVEWWVGTDTVKFVVWRYRRNLLRTTMWFSKRDLGRGTIQMTIYSPRRQAIIRYLSFLFDRKSRA